MSPKEFRSLVLASLLLFSAIAAPISGSVTAQTVAGNETETYFSLNPSPDIELQLNGPSDEYYQVVITDGDGNEEFNGTVPADTYANYDTSANSVNVEITGTDASSSFVAGADASNNGYGWLTDKAVSSPTPTGSSGTATSTSYTFTGSPGEVLVDTTNVNGTFTAEWSADGIILARDTYDATSINDDELVLMNEGAYQKITVELTTENGDVSGAKFDTRDGLGQVDLSRTVVGTTGGDSDLTCDTSERLSSTIQSYPYLDCTPNPGQTGEGSVDTNETDAAQLKLDIYQSAQASQSSADTYLTTLNNYLNDTRNTARIIGKNAYIRALNNGSSESVARSAARQAVAEYYTVKQVNLINRWTQAVNTAQYLDATATSEGVGSEFLYVQVSDRAAGQSTWTVKSWNSSDSVGLANGSSASVPKIVIEDGAGSPDYARIDRGRFAHSGTPDYDMQGIGVQAPNSNYEPIEMIRFDAYAHAYAEIGQQNQQVQADMETLANNTYDEYQSGEINNSDLVDPYQLARRSPGDDFQTWAAGQLVLTGQGVPEDFDQLGYFNITTEAGDQYKGILTSPENPPSGQFAVGETYNPANIGGTQYIILSDRYVELESNFTIHEIRTVDNQSRQNVTIETTSYQTSNVSQLQDQIDYLIELREEQEAREKNQDGGSGGGSIIGSGNNTILLVLAGAVVALLLAGGD